MDLNRVVTLLLLNILFFGGINGQMMRMSKFHDPHLPNIELNPDYGFDFPVNADVLSAVNYQPSFSNRYYMSLFGPRYQSTASSSIGFYDFHQGEDISYGVTWNNVVYDQNTLYHIVCNCDGVIRTIIDGPDHIMDNTATGRSVQVKCDSNFRNPANWGPIYINYRHLSALHTLADSAKGEAPESVRIAKGDTIGIVGKSGYTTTVHLHTSVQRLELGTNTTDLKNVHPFRIYPPTTTPHLHKILERAKIELLESWTDSALFRIYIPYNEVCVKRIEIRNHDYYRLFDFEDVSDSLDRDNHALIPGIELFAYSFNRGSTALSRFNSTKATMPAAYPASPNRPNNTYQHPITADSAVYILDLKVKDLPSNHQASDFTIKLSDIYGNVVKADFGTVWDGGQWSNGVPNAQTNAIIASNLSPGSFSCRNLSIEKGHYLNTDLGPVDIYGDVYNHGLGFKGNSLISFKKSGTSYLFEDTIPSTAAISIEAGTTLQSNDLLRLSAESPSIYGQLSGNGQFIGKVEVHQFLNLSNGARWFDIAPNVNGASLADYNENGNILVAANSANGSIWVWDAASANYVAPSSTAEITQAGKAYSVFAGTSAYGSFLRPDAGTISIVGEPQMNDVIIPLGYNDGQNSPYFQGKSQNESEGWNMIGNPFPTQYNWAGQDFNGSQGVSNAIYIYDGAADRYASFVDGLATNGGSSLIAPGQGFFIQTHAPNPGSLTLAASNRTVNGNTPFLKRAANFIKLTVATKDSLVPTDDLIIAFNNQSSLNFDPSLDAWQRLNGNTTPNLYALINQEKYAICQIPSSPNQRIIPLGLSYQNHGTEMIINANLDAFTGLEEAILFDHLKNTHCYLSRQKSYHFYYDSTYVHGRFSLILYPISLGTKAHELEPWFVYSQGSELGIICTSALQGSVAYVYSISGKLVEEVALQESKTRILQNHRAGIYLVRLLGSNVTQKVVKH